MKYIEPKIDIVILTPYGVNTDDVLLASNLTGNVNSANQDEQTINNTTW